MTIVRFVAMALLLFAPCALLAQTSVPANQVSALKDTSSLKPPSGTKIAIIEYEDLECPYCAHAFPIVHAAAKHYQIPVVECDYQITYHHWSHDAAICAHYLNAKVSPSASEEYRREVFASQFRIASRDDLQRFNQMFFAEQKKSMPFVMDPTGQFAKEISSTTDRGNRIGVPATPSIFVVTDKHWIEVKDVDHLYEAIDEAKRTL